MYLELDYLMHLATEESHEMIITLHVSLQSYTIPLQRYTLASQRYTLASQRYTIAPS